MHEPGEIFLLYVLSYEACFKIRMDAMFCDVPVRILAYPPVVFHARMQRLRAVSNIMPQPSRIKDDVVLEALRFFLVFVRQGVPILAHRHLHPLENFHRYIWLQSNFVWK